MMAEGNAKAKKGLTIPKLALYLVIFYAVWTLRELFVRREMVALLGEWGEAWAGGAVKVLIWTVPALLLVRRYREDMAIPDVFAGRIQWRTLLIWLLIIAVYNVAASWFLYGTPGIQPGFAPSSLVGTVLLVGITEEAVFRGLLLNTLLKRTKQSTALAICAVLFVLIHFPIWYTKGILCDPLLLLRSCISIAMLSVVFSLSFIRDKNLLSPILLHMLWNLCALLLFE